MTSLHFRPLVDAKELSGFKCGIEEMDDFIQNGLDESLVDNHCEAYVVIDIANTIVGFFALCQDTLCLDEDYKDDLLNGYSVTKIPNFIDENEKNAFLRQNVFTTLDVAYLAVIDNRQRDGIGTAIMNKIFSIARSRQNYTFVTVDALTLKHRNYSAVGFYLKCGFQPMYPPTSENTVRMFSTIFR